MTPREFATLTAASRLRAVLAGNHFSVVCRSRIQRFDSTGRGTWEARLSGDHSLGDALHDLLEPELSQAYEDSQGGGSFPREPSPGAGGPLEDGAKLLSLAGSPDPRPEEVSAGGPSSPTDVELDRVRQLLTAQNLNAELFRAGDLSAEDFAEAAAVAIEREMAERKRR